MKKFNEMIRYKLLIPFYKARGQRKKLFLLFGTKTILLICAETSVLGQFLFISADKSDITNFIAVTGFFSEGVYRNRRDVL